MGTRAVRGACALPPAAAAYIAEVNNHAGMYASLSAALANYHASRQASGTHASTSASAANLPAGSRVHRRLSPEQLSAFCPETVMVGAGACSRVCTTWHARHGLEAAPALLGGRRGGPPWSSHSLARAHAQVGSRLLLDMEKAGIHLPAQQQARMRQLMNDSNHYAAEFNAALVKTDPSASDWLA